MHPENDDNDDIDDIDNARAGRLTRPMWITLGFVSLGLGGLGVALPLLPTTPFLLFSSYCFAKGSRRFHRWLKSTRIYREHLEDFERDRTMTLRTKVMILVPVTLMLVAAFVSMSSVPGRIAIGVLLVAKYYYFAFRIRTGRSSPRPPRE